jgi:AGZA family xanthine/uracil permease-like MFS transporter
MPLTWSIANGIGVGVIAHVVVMTIAGRARAVRPLVWIVAGAFGAFFALG